jgi:uncharacterized membrane protein
MSAELLAFVAALLRGVGQALQKRGAASTIGGIGLPEFPRAFRSLSGLARNATWIAGAVVLCASIPFTVQALAYGDVSVVVPIFTLSLPISTLLGVWVLREELTLVEWAAIATMFFGAGLAASAVGAFDPALVERGDALDISLSALAAVALFLAARPLLTQWVPREIGYAGAWGLLGGTCNSLIKLTAALVMTRAGGFQIHEPATLALLALEPASYLVVLFFAGGLLMEQLSFANGRLSVILPVRSAASLSLVVLVGSLVFEEHIGARRLIGVILLVGGTGSLGLHLSRLRPRAGAVPGTDG